MTVYCATTNRGKLREFQDASGDIEIAVLPAIETIPPPEETGITFEDNAALKAVYYSRFAPGLVIADDSGLAVDALGGQPGVRSARFAGPGANDAANNSLLLDLLRGVEQRTARFLCVIALAQDGQLVKTFQGVVEGRIIDTPRGDQGFGYDPIFLYPPANRTLAEIGTSEKFNLSHRGEAVRRLLDYLRTEFPQR